jgi:hypothetical protein
LPSTSPAALSVVATTFSAFFLGLSASRHVQAAPARRREGDRATKGKRNYHQIAMTSAGR